MANFDDIQTANPTATPEDTDLIVVQKADGSAAAYTLLALSTYVSGASVPQWQTDNALGCALTVTYNTDPTIAHTIDGVVPYNTIIRDNGFYTSEGVITVPAGVTKIQIVGQVKTGDAAPVVRIIKDGS